MVLCTQDLLYEGMLDILGEEKQKFHPWEDKFDRDIQEESTIGENLEKRETKLLAVG